MLELLIYICLIWIANGSNNKMLYLNCIYNHDLWELTVKFCKWKKVDFLYTKQWHRHCFDIYIIKLSYFIYVLE